MLKDALSTCEATSICHLGLIEGFDYQPIFVIFKCASDASYADGPQTRRSTEGFLFKLFGGAVDWKSLRRQTVTTYTTFH